MRSHTNAIIVIDVLYNMTLFKYTSELMRNLIRVIIVQNGFDKKMLSMCTLELIPKGNLISVRLVRNVLHGMANSKSI